MRARPISVRVGLFLTTLQHGEQQEVETIEGYMISLPPGVYLEIESVPAETSDSQMKEFNFFINGAITPLLNITVGYTKRTPPTTGAGAALKPSSQTEARPAIYCPAPPVIDTQFETKPRFLSYTSSYDAAKERDI